MIITAGNEGRRTRNTLRSSQSVPAGYRNLFQKRRSADTTEFNGPWDEHWIGRTTEMRPYCQVRAWEHPITVPDLLASGLEGSLEVRKYLTTVLLSTAQRPDVTEATESLKTSLTDWSDWHDLKAKEAKGSLSPPEAIKLSLLKAQTATLDASAVSRQANAIRPVLQQHQDTISSLSRIVQLLEDAIGAIERKKIGEISH